MLLMIAPLTLWPSRIGIDQTREVADLDAGIDAIFVEQALERLRLERNPAIVVRDPELRRHLGPEKAALVHGLDQFEREAADQRALPSPIGPNVFTRPDVDMPPRHPVASTSSTLAPSRAAQMAAALPAGPPPATRMSYCPRPECCA